MIWFILFIISMLILLFSRTKGKIRKLYGYGLFLATLNFFIEILGESVLVFWRTQGVIEVFGVPIFLLFTYFIWGMLIVDYCPKKLSHIIIYILILTTLTVLIEYFLIKLGYVEWLSHYPYLCILIHVLVLSSLIIIKGHAYKIYFS